MNPPLFEKYFLGLCRGGGCHIIGFDNPLKNYEKSMLNNDDVLKLNDGRYGPIQFATMKTSIAQAKKDIGGERKRKREKEGERERGREKRTTLTHTHVVPVLSLDII